MSLLRHNIIYLIGSAFGSGSYYIITTIVLSYLSNEEFADTELFYTYSLLGLYLFGFNAHVAITRFKFETAFDLNRKRAFEKNIFVIIWFGFVIQCLFIFALGDYLGVFLDIPNNMIWVLPLGITGMFLYNTIQTILVSDKKPKHYSFFQIAIGMSKLLMIVMIFVIIGWGNSFTKVLMESLVVVSIGVGFYFRNYLKVSSMRHFREDLRYAANFSLPLIFYVIGNVILNFSDQWLIKYYLDKDALAIYSIAYRYGFISMIFFNASSNYFSIDFYDSFDRAKDRIKGLLEKNQMILFFFCLVLIIGKRLFFQIVTSWDEQTLLITESITEIIVVSYFVIQYYMIWIRLLFHLKKTLLISAVLATGVICNVLLNLLLIPEYQLMGAAVATLASTCLISIVSIIIHKFNKSLKEHTQLNYWYHVGYTIILGLLCYIF